MTTKARETATKTESPAADEKATTTAGTKAETAKAPEDPRVCVVDDGTPHMGRATPGARICSAHAMRYRADGTPR